MNLNLAQRYSCWVAGLSSGVDGDEAEAEAVSNGDSCDDCDDIRIWWGMVTAGSFSSKKPNSSSLSSSCQTHHMKICCSLDT